MRHQGVEPCRSGWKPDMPPETSAARCIAGPHGASHASRPSAADGPPFGASSRLRSQHGLLVKESWVLAHKALLFPPPAKLARYVDSLRRVGTRCVSCRCWSGILVSHQVPPGPSRVAYLLCPIPEYWYWNATRSAPDVSTPAVRQETFPCVDVTIVGSPGGGRTLTPRGTAF